MTDLPWWMEPKGAERPRVGAPKPAAEIGACNACGSRERVVAFSFRGFALRGCRDCSLALAAELRRIWRR